MERPDDTARMRAASERFYELVLHDPELAGMRRPEGEEAERRAASMFFRFALGGDALVPRSTFVAHRPAQLDDESFGRVVAHLVASLGEAGVDDAVIARAERELSAVRRHVLPPGLALI